MCLGPLSQVKVKMLKCRINSSSATTTVLQNAHFKLKFNTWFRLRQTFSLKKLDLRNKEVTHLQQKKQKQQKY